MNKLEATKYCALEKAMYDLRMAGYSINDSVYCALIKERAQLECPKTRVLTHDYSVVEGGVTNWEQNADILIMSLEHCKDLGRKKFAREEIRRMGRIIDAYKEFNLKTPVK